MPLVVVTISNDFKNTRVGYNMSVHSDRLAQFLDVSYSGRKLLKHHNLDEYGTWHVRGEDPNCDMGGPHHMPDLGYFKGTLEEVINRAVDLPRFWSWGGGGDISKVVDNVVTTLSEPADEMEQ